MQVTDAHIFFELIFYEIEDDGNMFITESIYGHRHVIYDFETMKYSQSKFETKRNELGSAPNSFSTNLIFTFV